MPDAGSILRQRHLDGEAFESPRIVRASSRPACHAPSRWWHPVSPV